MTLNESLYLCHYLENNTVTSISWLRSSVSNGGSYFFLCFQGLPSPAEDLTVILLYVFLLYYYKGLPSSAVDLTVILLCGLLLYHYLLIIVVGFSLDFLSHFLINFHKIFSIKRLFLQCYAQNVTSGLKLHPI